MTTIPRSEINLIMEQHHDGFRAARDITIKSVRYIAGRVRRINEIQQADDLDALCDRYEREATDA